MTGSDRNKKRRSLKDGFDNVPKILDEARRAVDEVTQPTPGLEVQAPEAPLPETAEAGVAPRKAPAPKPRREQGPRKAKPASRVSKAQKPVPPPEPPEKLAAPLAQVPEPPSAPLRTLDYYGIRIRHRLYGRIRLHIRRMKYNWGLAERIRRGLADVQGIADVEASAATGSLLVVFDPRALAVPQSRRDFSALMEGFFPGLDGDSLMRKFL